MNASRIVTAASLCLSSFAWIASAMAEQPYIGDPDQSKPTLHVQPRPLTPAQASQAPRAPADVINGITYIDVLAAAGFDIGGGDYGNETSVTANPLNPNQIVLTSFSGSDWPTGGNSSLWYSGDGGTTWSYSLSVPPPPGTSTNYYCPCDQEVDWGRNGLLYATFLHYNTGDTVQTVFSAQAADPTNPASWTYRAPGGVAQSTNSPAYFVTDQPWLATGPLPGDTGQTNVCVAYDDFQAGVAIRVADSPGASPLDFSRDNASIADPPETSIGMNPGHRIAVGPDGKMFDLHQRFVADAGSGVKQLTYLLTVSTDGGSTWSVANANHPSGGRAIASDVFSFQGYASKIGGVNALLGGVDALTVDPRTGVVWVVYGRRTTVAAHDQLFLVKVTYNAGSLLAGAPLAVTPGTIDAYLPSVAVLPNGEVGVLYLTLSGANFQWNFTQYTNGTTFAKSTGFPVFTSPFASDPSVGNQRIFGDYVQVRAVGCKFFGAFPARGVGVFNVNSIDPYFISAPSFNACSLPALTSLDPIATCAGGPGVNVALRGTGFTNGATGRVQGALRTTTYNSATQVTTAVQAADLALPGVLSIDLLGAAPAGGLTGSLPLTVEAPAGSPAASLRADPSGSNVALAWDQTSGATSYQVKRCIATAGPCAPAPLAVSATNGYQDAVRLDSDSYWYQIDAVNSCGATP